ncbi:MAG: hypothetical protein LUQ65_06855 [Candidatus Helarchaeota archaeon]|nr:hypothetical protein [Candidatus Helarchaeota archaeon]
MPETWAPQPRKHPISFFLLLSAESFSDDLPAAFHREMILESQILPGGVKMPLLREERKECGG